MCFLGTVLRPMLVPAGHLHVCSLNRVTVEINLCATCHIFALPSFASQNSIATSILASSEPKSNSKVFAVNQKISMLFLSHKSDSCHSGIVLKFWLWLYFGGFVAECAFRLKSQGIEKLNFSPKGPRTVYIWDMKSLIIVDLK